MSHFKLLRAGVVPAGGSLALALLHQRTKGNPVECQPLIKKSMSSYPANNPCEDRSIFHEHEDSLSGCRMCIFGVFDGHGGWNVSNYLQNNFSNVFVKNYESLLIADSHSESHQHEKQEATVVASRREKEAPLSSDGKSVVIEKSLHMTFTELEEVYIEKIRSAYELGFGDVARVGSCALVAVKHGNSLVIANSGDCLAVLGQKIDNSSGDASSPAYLAHQINREHNARSTLESLLLARAHPNEDNIVKCKNPHACYVKGRLQLTRSFGDLYLKSHDFNAPPGEHRSRGRHIPAPYTPPYVEYIPDIYQHDLTQKDEFIILATDGLWDFMDPQEAVDIVAKFCPAEHEKAAEALVEETLRRAAHDANVSVEELTNLPLGKPRRSRFDDTTVVVVYL